MKRAAAIIGPTPSFVRWAIHRQCELKQLDGKNLPYETFRQLRSIRALSDARLQDRVVDGFCIHGEYNSEPETARGFPESEIFELFGGQARLQNLCGPCPANSKSDNQSQRWAGCFGYFFSKFDHANLIEQLQHFPDRHTLPFPPAKRLWFSLWQTQVWDPKRLLPLQTLVRWLAERTAKKSGTEELNEFQHAVDRCMEHQLVLETELIPQGHSDGLNWKIEPCCSICRCEWSAESRQCHECGHTGASLPAQKRKVLGFRPYMLLKDIIGIEATQTLIAQYRSRSKDVSG